MADKKIKTRKANWADSEIICLVSDCTDNIKLITAKHGLVSESDKTVFWRNICERINSIGGCERSVEEVIKKWKDLKSQTKKKEQLQRRESSKTGGGESSNSLKEWEEKIITIIPDDVLHGIAGGEDIFQNNEKGETGRSSGGSVETVLNVGKEEVVLVHEDNVNVQVKIPPRQTEQNIDRLVGSKKRKRSLSEMETAQMEFYLENAALCREEKKLVSQKLKTLTAQEAFFIEATKKLSQDNISSLLNILTEQ